MSDDAASMGVTREAQRAVSGLSKLTIYAHNELSCAGCCVGGRLAAHAPSATDLCTRSAVQAVLAGMLQGTATGYGVV